MQINCGCIVGHSQQQIAITKFFKGGNLNRSFIFFGQEGIGKKKLALEMTKYILAGISPSGESLDFSHDALLYDDDEEAHRKSLNVLATEIGRMADSQTHPDLVFVNSEDTSISLEDYRERLEKIYKKSMLGGWKVLIIDGAEKMNTYFFNSMLKLFEEPPADTTIILITANISIIPKTLVSRCVKFSFAPLTCENILQIAGKIENDVEHVASLVKISQGSMKFYLKLKELDGYRIYCELLDICKMSLLSQGVEKDIRLKFLALYDSYKLKENWFILRKFFIRVLQIILLKICSVNEKDFGDDFHEQERLFLDNIHEDTIDIEKLDVAMDIFSYVDSLQLDTRVFGVYFLENLGKILNYKC